MSSALIIGGGVTGLSLAYRLNQAGVNCRLFEPDSLGGVVRTIHAEGFTLEQGPNVLLEKEDLASLIRDLGLDSKVVHPEIPKYKQLVWYRGAAHRVPKSPLALLTTPLIPALDKMSLLRNLFSRNLFKTTCEDESVYDLFTRIMGESAVQRIMDPALQGIFGGDLTRLSARSLFGELWSALRGGKSILEFARSRAKKNIFVLKGGMETLVHTLVESIRGMVDITEERVVDLKKLDSGDFCVTTESGGRFVGERVYVCTSGGNTATYLKDLDGDLAHELNELSYAPLVVIHCAVDVRCACSREAFGVLFPAGQTLLGIMFNSILFPHLAPRGRQLLTVCLGGVRGDSLCERSDEELQTLVVDELRDKLGIQGASVLSLKRWKRAIPQYEVGHHKLVELMKRCESRNSGIYFCGSDVGGVGVPDRISAVISTLKKSGQKGHFLTSGGMAVHGH